MCVCWLNNLHSLSGLVGIFLSKLWGEKTHTVKTPVGLVYTQDMQFKHTYLHAPHAYMSLSCSTKRYPLSLWVNRQRNEHIHSLEGGRRQSRGSSGVLSLGWQEMFEVWLERQLFLLWLTGMFQYHCQRPAQEKHSNWRLDHMLYWMSTIGFI